MYGLPGRSTNCKSFTEFFRTLRNRWTAGGDYNAQHTAWGFLVINIRRRKLLKASHLLECSFTSRWSTNLLAIRPNWSCWSCRFFRVKKCLLELSICWVCWKWWAMPTNPSLQNIVNLLLDHLANMDKGTNHPNTENFKFRCDNRSKAYQYHLYRFENFGEICLPTDLKPSNVEQFHEHFSLVSVRYTVQPLLWWWNEQWLIHDSDPVSYTHLTLPTIYSV